MNGVGASDRTPAGRREGTFRCTQWRGDAERYWLRHRHVPGASMTIATTPYVVALRRVVGV